MTKQSSLLASSVDNGKSVVVSLNLKELKANGGEGVESMRMKLLNFLTA
jgi:hypothetical protein